MARGAGTPFRGRIRNCNNFMTRGWGSYATTRLQIMEYAFQLLFINLRGRQGRLFWVYSYVNL